MIACYAATIEDSLKGVINNTGKIILSPHYEDLDNLSKSAIFFKQGQRWGTMDLRGKVLLQPKFDAVNTVYETFDKEPFPKVIRYRSDVADLVRNWIKPPNVPPTRAEPSEGYAIARDGVSVQFIGSDGYSVAGKFDDAFPFSEGLAL